MKSDFAYDDAFRTIESECDDLLIPFVNYFHNESYGSSAKIIRGRNEHFIEDSDHSEDKRITDSAFEIEEYGRSRGYHYECESKRDDDTLLVRMFEYDAHISLDLADLDKHCLHVDFQLSTPGGTIRYPVMVRRMSELSLSDIFEKHLYLLLPFYIFNLENELNAMDSDPAELEKFADIYRDIISRLEMETEKGYLSLFSCSVILYTDVYIA